MKLIARTFESKGYDESDPLEHTFEKVIDPSRVRRFTASDDTIDRYGEVVLARGVDFSEFKKNPVIMRFHNTRDLMPIGKAVAGEVRGDAVLLDIEFDPPEIDEEADQVLAKIDHKTVKAGSVGFLPKSEGILYPSGKSSPEAEELFKQYPGVRCIYTDWELLEYSIVPVPANPNAILNAYRALHENALQRFGPGSGNAGMEPAAATPGPKDELTDDEVFSISERIRSMKESFNE